MTQVGPFAVAESAHGHQESGDHESVPVEGPQLRGVLACKSTLSWGNARLSTLASTDSRAVGRANTPNPFQSRRETDHSASTHRYDRQQSRVAPATPAAASPIPQADRLAGHPPCGTSAPPAPRRRCPGLHRAALLPARLWPGRERSGTPNGLAADGSRPASPRTTRRSDCCRCAGSARPWPASGNTRQGHASPCTPCAATCSTRPADPPGP